MPSPKKTKTPTDKKNIVGFTLNEKDPNLFIYSIAPEPGKPSLISMRVLRADNTENTIASVIKQADIKKTPPTTPR